MGQEIERKWLVSGFPHGLTEIRRSLAFQQYISTDPEMRVRRCIDTKNDMIESYELTCKSKGGIVRAETNMELTKDMYEALSGSIKQQPIIKVERVYRLDNGMELEVNHVDDKFYYAEIEGFDSEAAAKEYKPCQEMLDIILTDVSESDYHKMAAYWNRVSRGEKEE